MSARNPFRIYRDRIKALSTKAYVVHGMRDPWKIGEYCHQELWATFDPKMRVQSEIALIVELIVSRKEQMNFETPDFFRDQELKFVLRKDGKSECIMLRDIGLDDIPIITRQKVNNITAVTKAHKLWLSHCAVIEPLLREHKDWKWGDACDWIEKHIGFPPM